MIILHRFKAGKEFVLNANLIKYVEATPDTVITLVSNDKILVNETPAEVVRKVVEFSRASRLPAEYLVESAEPV